MTRALDNARQPYLLGALPKGSTLIGRSETRPAMM
jgi:hypothetical protein